MSISLPIPSSEKTDSKLVIKEVVNVDPANDKKTEEEEKFYNNRSDLYAYAIMFILLLVRCAFIWQRKSFNYIYGFKGDGFQLGNPDYEILSAYPNMDRYYGTLAGLAYSVPNSICGLFVSLMPKGFNRKYLLAAVTVIAGLSMSLTGWVNSILVLALMRMLHAACQSVTNPLLYSITADYFPKNRRGTANSILQSANNIGIAMSSLSIIII